jgi:two-component system sensor histidine kinase ChiS
MAMSTRTIFVADDIPALRKGLNLALMARGYSVRTAVDGPTLLSMLEAERPDLLLLDVMMPGMSGLEVLRRIREDERWSDLPVLLVTAAAGAELCAAVPEGAPEIVPKPFRLQELLHRIEVRLLQSAT